MKVLQGPVGLCHQRNTGLRALNPRCELVSFLDDDVELATDYCRQLCHFMQENQSVIGVGGRLLLDGTTRQEAQTAINQAIRNSADEAKNATGLYGCNMSFRRGAMQDERFDERLSLYAWLEDFDFSIRMSRKGRLMMVPSMLLCHLRSLSGRMCHERFGFAQIMNPWYLCKKGIITRKEMWNRHLLRVFAANLTYLPADARNRSLRLRGNFRALALIARRKIQPEAVKHIRR
jgi:GT2 family glycosyltransferase